MKTKLLGLFGLSILSLIVLMGLGSAVTLADWSLTSNGVASNVNTNVNAGDFTGGSGISAVTFGTDGASASSWSTGAALDANDYFQITLSPKTGFTLTLSDVNFGERRSLAGIRNYTVQWSKSSSFTSPNTLATVNVPDDTAERTGNITGLNIAVNDGETIFLRFFGYTAELAVGTWRINDGTLNVLGTVTTTPAPLTEPTEIATCNAVGNPGELRVKDIDFKNFGILHLKNTDPFYIEFGDDDEWFPLDEVEVEIEIENNGDFDVDDIEIEWGIYNTKSNELIIEFDDEKDFNLKDGKDEIITVSFQLEDDLDVDLEDLDDGKHYRFYVTARGVIEDSKSPNDGEDTCDSGFETAEIIIESDFVVLNHIDFPETVQCNAAVQITAEVWNIGDDDQDEVKVEVHNSALGLFHKMIEIGDIDSFDDDAYSFNFDVPRNVEEKTHTLEFRVFDEDFDVYENDFDDDESKFFLPFRVSGGCSSTTTSDVSISANLESGGKAGEELTVRATITNNEDELSTFIVRAAGFSQWASSFIADRSSLVLDAGDSADVIFTFDVNSDASGSQSFFIELVSENNQVTTQPVSVEIEGKSGGFLGRLTGGATSGGNAYLWGIGILNIILVVIIIIVAVRIARR